MRLREEKAFGVDKGGGDHRGPPYRRVQGGQSHRGPGPVIKRDNNADITAVKSQEILVNALFGWSRSALLCLHAKYIIHEYNVFH